MKEKKTFGEEGESVDEEMEREMRRDLGGRRFRVFLCLNLCVSVCLKDEGRGKEE